MYLFACRKVSRRSKVVSIAAVGLVGVVATVALVSLAAIRHPEPFALVGIKGHHHEHILVPEHEVVHERIESIDGKPELGHHTVTSLALDSTAQTKMLDAHNGYRCMHGVPLFTWDDTVAATAQSWANYLKTQDPTSCSMKHSTYGSVYRPNAVRNDLRICSSHSILFSQTVV